MRILAIALTLTAMMGCSDTGVSGETSTEDSTEESTDSSLACNHFRNVAGDYDVLTPAELREKLKEVYDNSIIASPEVRSAARSMLAAATAGDDSALGKAVREMGAACEDQGV